MGNRNAIRNSTEIINPHESPFLHTELDDENHRVYIPTVGHPIVISGLSIEQTSKTFFQKIFDQVIKGELSPYAEEIKRIDSTEPLELFPTPSEHPFPINLTEHIPKALQSSTNRILEIASKEGITHIGIISGRLIAQNVLDAVTVILKNQDISLSSSIKCLGRNKRISEWAIPIKKS